MYNDIGQAAAIGQLQGQAIANANNLNNWKRAYNNLMRSYNKLMKEYNELVGRFNKLIARYEDKEKLANSLDKDLTVLKFEFTTHKRHTAFLREHEALKAEMLFERQVDFKRLLSEIIASGGDANSIQSYIEEHDEQAFSISDDAAATRKLENLQAAVNAVQNGINEITAAISSLEAEMLAMYDATGYTEDKYKILLKNTSVYRNAIKRHENYNSIIEESQAILDGSYESKGVFGFRSFIYSYKIDNAEPIEKTFKNKKSINNFVKETQAALDSANESKNSEKRPLEEYVDLLKLAIDLKAELDEKFIPARAISKKISIMETELVSAKKNLSDAQGALRLAVEMTEKCNLLNDLTAWC